MVNIPFGVNQENQTKFLPWDLNPRNATIFFMIIIAYVVAVIVYWILDVISTNIFLTIFSVAMAFIHKDANANERFNTQLFAAFMGTFTAAYIAFLSFSWFDIVPNRYLLIPILTLFWLVTNSSIAPEHKPTAQRLGMVSAMVLLLFDLV